MEVSIEFDPTAKCVAVPWTAKYARGIAKVIPEADAAVARAAINQGSDTKKEENEGRSQTDECSICLEEPKSPRLCRNGHAACFACISKWVAKTPTCPSCRTRLTTADIPRRRSDSAGGATGFLSQTDRQLLVSCQRCSGGWIGSMGQLFDEHWKNCPDAEVSCSACARDARFRRRDFGAHLFERHRVSPCTVCRRMIPYGDGNASGRAEHMLHVHGGWECPRCAHVVPRDGGHDPDDPQCAVSVPIRGPITGATFALRATVRIDLDGRRVLRSSIEDLAHRLSWMSSSASDLALARSELLRFFRDRAKGTGAGTEAAEEHLGSGEEEGRAPGPPIRLAGGNRVEATVRLGSQQPRIQVDDLWLEGEEAEARNRGNFHSEGLSPLSLDMALFAGGAGAATTLSDVEWALLSPRLETWVCEALTWVQIGRDAWHTLDSVSRGLQRALGLFVNVSPLSPAAASTREWGKTELEFPCVCQWSDNERSGGASGAEESSSSTNKQYSIHARNGHSITSFLARRVVDMARRDQLRVVSLPERTILVSVTRSGGTGPVFRCGPAAVANE